MTKFSQVETEEATGKTKELYNGITKAFGKVPNLFKMLGGTPDVLESVLLFNSSITSGKLSAKDVEQIALTASSVNQCNYCVSTHIAVGTQLKISETELMNNIQAISDNPRTSAILLFTKEATLNRGKVSDETVNSLREFGIDNSTIIEILGVIGLYSFLNYLNHLTQPVIDFPVIEYQPITK